MLSPSISDSYYFTQFSPASLFVVQELADRPAVICGGFLRKRDHSRPHAKSLIVVQDHIRNLPGIHLPEFPRFHTIFKQTGPSFLCFFIDPPEKILSPEAGIVCQFYSCLYTLVNYFP